MSTASNVSQPPMLPRQTRFSLLLACVFGLPTALLGLSLSGRITDQGQPVPDVLVAVSGNSRDFQAMTDQDGFYSVDLPENPFGVVVIYFVAPSQPGYGFIPPIASVVVVSSSVTVPDFTRYDAVNDPPEFGAVPVAVTMQGVPITVELPVTDPDTPADLLSLSAASGNLALIPDSEDALALGGSGTARTLTLTPAAGYSGTAPIQVTLSDGEHEVSMEFALEVRPNRSIPELELRFLAEAEPGLMHLEFADLGSGVTHVVVEGTQRLGTDAVWTNLSDVVITALGGDLYRAAFPASDREGFLRLGGLRPVAVSLETPVLSAEEGTMLLNPVAIFDTPFVGALGYRLEFELSDGSVEQTTGSIAVNGNTAAIPLTIADNLAADPLRSIWVSLIPGDELALGTTGRLRVDVVDNDGLWTGLLTGMGLSEPLEIATLSGPNGLVGLWHGDGSGVLPAGAWPGTVAWTESSFVAAFGPVVIPPERSPGGAGMSVSLRLEADAAQEGESVSDSLMVGSGTLAFSFSGRPHLNHTHAGSFVLVKSAQRSPAAPVQLLTDTP